MADELPDKFDLIVIGTGFPESCVAAAASRIGKTVLHIDPNDFYGGAWASFSLESLNVFLESGSNDEVRNATYKWYAEEESAPSEENAEEATNDVVPRWTQKELLQQSRRFNLDLCPKILYSAGQLVQLLVSSNICRYAEFRAVDRVCTRFNGEILNVPCSRSDVFNTKDLNIVEKRLLMKFLTICMTYGEDKCEEDMSQYRGKSFREYLLQQKMTDKIATCIMQAIAMSNEDTTFEEGIQQVRKFLDSLGRYGNTPFLFPMYGCGEIPQCFCRLCAVFGGIYCLKRNINGITINADTSCANVVIEGRTVQASHVVCSHGNVPPNLRQSPVAIHGLGPLVNALSRAIIVAKIPLGNEELNTGGGGVNLLRLLSGSREAILLQLSHYSGTCPKGIITFHITTSAISDNPEADLKPFMDQVFNEHTSNFLYTAFFTLTACERLSNAQSIDASTPLFCTAAPYYELDYDLSIRNAREIFAKIYGNVEFLPRAPDPEEIVIEGEDPRALSESNLPDDLREQLRELEKIAEKMDIEDEADHLGNE